MSYTEVLELRDAFFHNIPEAKKGKALIDKLLDGNKSEALSHLLRWHGDKRISNEETWERDAIDYFIEYFSLVSLADITGYLSTSLPIETRVEAAYYLGNVSIKRYYSTYYKVLLPMVLLQKALQANGSNESASTQGAEDKLTFYTFLSLNHRIIDEDIDAFLWLLDGGVYKSTKRGMIDLDALKAILRHPQRYSAILTPENTKTREFKLLLGCFKYFEFIQAFAHFLEALDDKPLSQSAYWHYHAYWFTRIKTKLLSTIHAFFKGLEEKQLKEAGFLTEVAQKRKAFEGAVTIVCDKEKYSAPLEMYYKRLLQ